MSVLIGLLLGLLLGWVCGWHICIRPPFNPWAIITFNFLESDPGPDWTCAYPGVFLVMAVCAVLGALIGLLL